MSDSRKNFIIYDDACGFCSQGIERLKKITGTQIDYIGRSKLNASSYGLQEKDLQESIKFIEFPETKVFSGAQAIFKAIAYNKFFKLPLCFYNYLPGFAWISEAVYKVIAKNRGKISQCTVSKPKN